MNKSIFNKWYRKAKYECWGFTAPAIPDNAAEEYAEQFYKTYYIPLAYIASNGLMSYSKFSKTVRLDSDIEEKINSMCEIPINEVFTYFNTRMVGLAWIPELPSFVRVYYRKPGESIKEALYRCWSDYLKGHTPRLAWFGVLNDEFAKDVFTISTKPKFYYNEGETYNDGNLIASLQNLPFISYDTSRIELARRVLKNYPEFIEYIPTAIVEQVVNGEAHEVSNVPVTALNTNGFPPIEAIQLYSVIPESEKLVHKTFTATLNYHLSIGAQVSKPVNDWLKSAEVVKYLSKYYNIKTDEINTIKDEIQVSLVNPPTPNTVKRAPVLKEVKEEHADSTTPKDSKELENVKKRLADVNVENIELSNKIKELEERPTLEQYEKLQQQVNELESRPSTEEFNELQEKYNQLLKSMPEPRFDDGLWKSDPIYKAALYDLYLIRSNLYRNPDKGHNLNAVTMQVPLLKLAFATDAYSMQELYDIIRLDEHETLSLTEEIRKQLLEYMRELM